ncbi:hypothetical protein FJY69_01865 [candidate division WOR-3 bacterium]|nr:hypothetical protein [candidate division WOR-3 bacterium]
MPGPCTIDSVQLLCGSDEYNHGIFYNAFILACHTTVTELESTFDRNYSGNVPETAMATSPLVLQWLNNHWHGLEFTRPFSYNGVDNLILEYRWQGDDGNSVYDRGFYTSGNRACDARSSTAPRGTPRNYMPRHRVFYSLTGIEEPEPPALSRFAGPSLVYDVLGRPVAPTRTGVYFRVAPHGRSARLLVIR